MEQKAKTSSLSGFLAPQLLLRKRSSSKDNFAGSPTKKDDLKTSSKFLKGLEADSQEPESQQTLAPGVQVSQAGKPQQPAEALSSSRAKSNRFGNMVPPSPESLKQSLESLCQSLGAQHDALAAQIESFEKSLRKLIESEYQKLKEAIIGAV